MITRRLKQALATAVLVPGLAGCGGGGGPAAPPPPTAPPTTTLPPATLAELSASTTSPQDGKQLNCRTSPRVRVAVANRAASSVGVTAIEVKTRILKGACRSGGDFTLPPTVDTVPAGASTRIFDGLLYLGGAGCCGEDSACDGRTTCQIEKSFAVATSVGTVEAGRITYRLNFLSCEPCEELGAAADGGPARACRPTQGY
jgi:hypothetical protein